MRKLTYIIFLFLLWSCDNFCDGYLTKEPTSDVTSGNYWQTETDVETAVRQVYSKYAEHFGGAAVRAYRNRALPFDVLSSTFLNVSKNYLHLRWAKDDARISWKSEYDIISEINKVLYYIGRAGLSPERHHEYVAQLKTMRAAVYLYVAMTWGDCPYKTDYFDVGPIARTPWEKVCDYCAADLEASIPFLSPASRIRNADGSLNPSKQIPSRGTAWTYLAWNYAWKGVLTNDPVLMKKAWAAADSVINSGDYELAPTVEDVCKYVLKGNSKEGIHEVDFYDDESEINRPAACLFSVAVQYPVVPNATPATNRSVRLGYEKARELFSPLDDWWESAFYKPDSMKLLPAAQTRGAVYVYKHRNVLVYPDGIQKGKVRALDENEIIFRLPDMYLLAAEMCARLGNSGMAQKYLNVIRHRANAPDYSESEGDLLRTIFKTWIKERFMEGLDFEYYLRMRFGYINELPGDFSAETDPDRLYLPIGEGAFKNNPLMTQNPYWQTKGY